MNRDGFAAYDDGRRIPITDDYMFSYAMRQPGICTEVIKCLLPDVPVAEVKFSDHADAKAEAQKTIQGNLGYHDVRLDVYLDDGKTVFNVEMQTGNKRNLPKRVRYYGSMLDCDQLEKSKDYDILRPTYVIFICTFDPFGQDRYRYAFENVCEEAGNLRLNDGSHKLFFNAAGHKGEISGELKALLAYFDEPEDLAADECKTELVRQLDAIVDEANQDADWRRKHMMYELKEMDKKKEGIEEGIKIGREEGIGIGREEGAGRMARLAILLAQEGKIADIARAGTDESFREKKMKEYGI